MFGWIQDIQDPRLHRQADKFLGNLASRSSPPRNESCTYWEKCCACRTSFPFLSAWFSMFCHDAQHSHKATGPNKNTRKHMKQHNPAPSRAGMQFLRPLRCLPSVAHDLPAQHLAHGTKGKANKHRKPNVKQWQRTDETILPSLWQESSLWNFTSLQYVPNVAQHLRHFAQHFHWTNKGQQQAILHKKTTLQLWWVGVGL